MIAKPTMLDTNVLSEVMRPQADLRVLAFVEPLDRPIVSAAVFHELNYGVEMLPAGNKRARLSAGIALLRERFRDRTIAIDAEVADISGRLRAGEQRSGFSLKGMDPLIAASAIAVSARLARRNMKDFERLNIELVNPWAG